MSSNVKQGFPMGKPVGEYVECGACKSTFNDRVLEMDPKAAAEKFEAAFSIAAKRVMFKMALADGDIDQSEIDTITQAFANITKREIDPANHQECGVKNAKANNRLHALAVVASV